MRIAPRRPPSAAVALVAVLLSTTLAACNAIFGITSGVPGGSGGSSSTGGGHGGGTSTGSTHAGTGGMSMGTGGMHASSGSTGGAHAGTGGTGGTGGMHAGTGGTGGMHAGSGGAGGTSTSTGVTPAGSSTGGAGGSDAGPMGCDGGGAVDPITLAAASQAQAGKQYSYVSPASVAWSTTDKALVLAGSYSGNGVRFGTTSLSEPDGSTLGTLFVAKVSVTGNWSAAADFSGTGDAQVTAMATTGAGEIVLVGYFSGSLTFPTTPNPTTLSTPASDATSRTYTGFVAKLGDNLAPLWAKQLSNSSASVLPTAVAIGSTAGDGGTADEIVIGGAGQAGATIAIGGATLSCKGTAPPASWPGSGFPFVAKLTAGGSCVWVDTFEVDLGFSAINDVAGPVALTLDANDDILLAGGSRNVNDWGTGNSVDPQGGDGAYTSYVAKLKASTGQHVWDASFGSSNNTAWNQVASAIALDACGNVLVAGSFTGNAQFGGLSASLLLDAGSTPTRNVFLAKLTPTGQPSTPLTPAWLKAYGDVGTQTAASLLVDGAGNVLLAGDATDGPGSTGLSFGSGAPLVNTSDDAGAYGTDFFLAMLDGQGNFLHGTRASCAASFGTDNPSINYVQNLPGNPVALAGSGSAFVTGQLGGTCNFGGGMTPLTPKGDTDLFLVGYH